MKPLLFAIIIITTILTACGAPASTPTDKPTPYGQPATGPKRITVGIRGTPHIFYNKLVSGIPGTDAVEEFLNAGLANPDDRGMLRPQLAEQVPTIENGLWKLFPDGSMELTWAIRPEARWHDSAPFTSEDLVFTARVVQDEQLPAFGDARYRYLEAVEPVGSYGVRVRWKQTFFEADLLFTRELGLPLPRHLLEATYRDDRASFMDHPFWSGDFIGTGPYRIREFARDSHLLLDANSAYVLGRPKVDAIEVRLIPDSNTLLVNIIAGYLDLTLGRSLSLDQALEARDRWEGGTMRPAASFLQRVHSQFVNPSPPVIGEVEFRRALFHAINRQEMVDVLQAGLTSVPRSFLPPGRPEYQDLERNVRQYEFDQGKAVHMIEALGNARRADGMFRLPNGSPLSVELRTTAGDDSREKMVLAIADYWQRVGVGVEPFMVPPRLNQDRENRANRTGFLLAAGESALAALGNMHSSQAPSPENGYSGNNIARYQSPEYDGLYERYLVTIPRAERVQLVARMLEHLADQVPSMPIFYRVEATMIAHRLKGVSFGTSESSRAWNVHEWDVS